jgi:hypothetical protein
MPLFYRSFLRKIALYGLLVLGLLLGVYLTARHSRFGSCLVYAAGGFRVVAADRADRFLGKVAEDTARCRGGETAVRWRKMPWLDWPRYWAAGGDQSRAGGLTSMLGFLSPNQRGIDGALLDLEYQRIELFKFNLFDNSGTYESYFRDRQSPTGTLPRVWKEMRLPPDHPVYAKVGGDGAQKCAGELVRFRTLTGICNDVFNPLMGATGEPFARNVEFEATFPAQSEDPTARHRHGGRLGLLQPDPQTISRKLFTRAQPTPDKCREGRGATDNSVNASCAYRAATHVNVLAAFWIQFMTHDWFSHLEEGHNDAPLMPTGCDTPGSEKALGCRAKDRIDKSFIAQDVPAPTFDVGGKHRLARAPKTMLNKVTAWWDASQIYGNDEMSQRRVKRDPRDPAKLLLDQDSNGVAYLPLLQKADPQNPQWTGQEAVAFPDNWNIGLSFFHNVFAREHNAFVDEFRRKVAVEPDADCGLRDPAAPERPIRYRDVSADDLFEVARLVVAAEIAKIHTIEWTPQMLYNEPLYLAMNANWSGLLEKHPLAEKALASIVERLARAEGNKSNGWYSAFAAGPGIVGLGSDKPDINGGVNHFGSPFNFPEEFINAYRLHAMVPDLIELRDLKKDANAIRAKIAVVNTVRGKATEAMHRYGITDWALSLGRQRAGALVLHNHPLFLQNLDMPRLKSASGKIDVLALDLIRDRERGLPRYNEFRRQYGLKQLTSFDDFINPRFSPNSPDHASQRRDAGSLREIYGQHRCDASKIITTAQKNEDGSAINDCFGRPDGSVVDNVEDLDALVGWLAEPVRPHGFAISETQLQVFILNASRRLFSDRFLTSSFRPAFYTDFGVQWVNNNGPGGKMMEKTPSNGHTIEVSPLKRVLLRTIPELAAELEPVVNVFDPWARERGAYYSLDWKPRRGAERDPAFQ